jgi:hypothetical protein
MWPADTDKQKTEEESEKSITDEWGKIGIPKNAIYKIKQAANYKISTDAMNKSHDYYLKSIKRTGIKQIRVSEFEQFVTWFIERLIEMEKIDDSAATNLPQN